MSEHRRYCTECDGTHPDGDCLKTGWGTEVDAERKPCMPSRKTIDAAATTMTRLRAQKAARLEQIERDFEHARDEVREIAAARSELRKDLRVLGQALRVVVAAAQATPHEKGGHGRRDIGIN